MDPSPARTFAFIGGHVALDVLNTVNWRLDPAQREEHLEAYAHVLDWAVQADLVSGPEHRALARLGERAPESAAGEAEAFRGLRETAYAALVERDEAAVRAVVAAHRDALDRAQLVRVGDHWHWTEPDPGLATPRDRVARAVVGLLTSPELAAIGQCEDAACGWVYLDTSPRHNRRWCVAADCGNRNRARRFYARKKLRAAESV